MYIENNGDEDGNEKISKNSQPNDCSGKKEGKGGVCLLILKACTSFGYIWLKILVRMWSVCVLGEWSR